MPLRVLPSPRDDADSAALVNRLFAATRLNDFSFIPSDFPVHVHAASGTPDLNAAAIHVFPDGFDDVDADLIAPDCGDNRLALFGGNVRCRRIHTGVWWGVAGTVEAKVIDGNSGCNCCLVAQALCAELILERGHSFEASSIVADVVYSALDMLEDPEDGTMGRHSRNPGELFADPFLDGEDDVDVGRLIDAVLQGTPWKR